MQSGAFTPGKPTGALALGSATPDEDGGGPTVVGAFADDGPDGPDGPDEPDEPDGMGCAGLGSGSPGEALPVVLEGASRAEEGPAALVEADASPPRVGIGCGTPAVSAGAHPHSDRAITAAMSADGMNRLVMISQP